MIAGAIDRVAAEIEANSDDGIVLTDVARHLPKKNGKRTNYSTIWRWATKGYSPGKVGIILETTLIGRCRYTSRQALRRFNRARNAIAAVRPIIADNLRLIPTTNTAAKRYLEKEGFGINHCGKKQKGLGHGHGTDTGRTRSAAG